MPSVRPITNANLGVNPDWAKLPLFARRGWTKARFGDVVENLNETERNPAEAGAAGKGFSDKILGMVGI
jgi:hypothetical protein